MMMMMIMAVAGWLLWQHYVYGRLMMRLVQWHWTRRDAHDSMNSFRMLVGDEAIVNDGDDAMNDDDFDLLIVSCGLFCGLNVCALHPYCDDDDGGACGGHDASRNCCSTRTTMMMMTTNSM